MEWNQLTPETCPEEGRPVLLRFKAGSVRQIAGEPRIQFGIVTLKYEADGFGNRRPMYWQQYVLNPDVESYDQGVEMEGRIDLKTTHQWAYLDDHEFAPCPVLPEF